MDHRNNFQIEGWTPPRIALLRRLWGTMTCAQVAREIGHGCTRNAVIGKAGRLGLSARKRERPKPPPPMPPRPRPMPAPPPPTPMPSRAPETSADAVHLLDLRQGQCRWVTDEAGFLYCGAPCEQGSSYCAHHRRISYQPYQPRREHR